MTDTTTPVPPEQAEEPPIRRPHTGWRARTTQLWASRGLAGAAAIAAGFASCSPTGTTVVDVVLTGAFAAVVTLAAARTRRWPLFVPVVVALALARDGVVLWALVATVTALIGATRRRRDRIWGAATGAFAVQALLRLPDIGFHGLTALITAAAVAPVLIASYQMCRRHERRIIRRTILGLSVLVAVIGAAYGAILLSVATDLEDAVSRSQTGLQATRDGETTDARGHFTAALDGFAAADARLNAWWAKPILAVPVAGQHARALGRATEDGRILTASARDTVESADYDRLRYESGRFDLARIEATAAPLDRTRVALDGALRGAEDTDSPWLLSPLSDRIDRFEAELVDAQREADVAAGAIAIAPDLLGGNGPRRFFIAFVTPVELRGSGGFMGSYGELTAEDGRIRLTRSGPVRELISAAPEGGATLTGPADYLARYGRFAPGRNIQDVTFSPHFPFDAEAIQQIYPQAGGAPVDGVISVDPIGLAELLRLTGPITVPGFGQAIDADNAAEFLLRDNYDLFPDSDAQNDALAELTEATFEELTTGDLPSPRRVAEVLSPVTRGGHLRLWSARPAEQAVFARVGATGALPAPDPGRDLLAVASQNAGNNKIDYYQRREVSYDVEVDRAGILRATARITVHNDAPTSGVADYVIRDRFGAPPGTNRMYLSVYSPHVVASATLDGAPTSLESLTEAGYHVATKALVIPPGGSTTLELHLEGRVRSDGPYRLDVVPQPTVIPDTLALDVTAAGGEPVHRAAAPVDQPLQIVAERGR